MNDDVIYDRERVSTAARMLQECHGSLIELDSVAEKSIDVLSFVNGVALLQQVDPSLFDDTLVNMLQFCKQNLDGLTGSLLDGIHNVEEYLTSLEHEAEEIVEREPSTENNPYGWSGHTQGLAAPDSSSSYEQEQVTEPPSVSVEETSYYEESSPSNYEEPTPQVDNVPVQEEPPHYEHYDKVSITDVVEQPMITPTSQALIPEEVVPDAVVEEPVVEVVAPTEPSLITKVEKYRNSIQGSLGTIGVPTSSKKESSVKETTLKKETTPSTSTTTRRGLTPLATAIVGGGIGAISLGIAGMSAYTMHKEEKEAHNFSQTPTYTTPKTEVPTEVIKDQAYYDQFFDIPYDEDE